MSHYCALLEIICYTRIVPSHKRYINVQNSIILEFHKYPRNEKKNEISWIQILCLLFNQPCIFSLHFNNFSTRNLRLTPNNNRLSRKII